LPENETGTQLVYCAAGGYDAAMPRKARVAPGGYVYHVLNRAAGRTKLFRNDGDFAGFERVLAEGLHVHPTRLLAWCCMSNHWHLVLWPRKDGELSAFVRWLTHTHVMRWRVAHQTVGDGPLYQGRFKSHLVEKDEHLLTVCRYTERNALSAGLVRRAQDWRHGSLWVRQHGSPEQRMLLSDWPVDRPGDWVERVNAALTRRELDQLETSERRGQPFGGPQWTQRTAQRLGLEHTLRREGRPSKTDQTKQQREN
jgi:putative transposase